MGGYCRAVIGRHRIDAARNLQYMTQNSIGASLVLADHDQRAGALPVKTKILGKGDGDQRLGNLWGDEPHAGGVGIQIDGESLIRKIQKWDEASTRQQLSQLLPLRRIEIGAGGIVATGVNQADIAFGGSVQALEHCAEAQLVRGCLVIGVAFESQARTAQQGRVVAPGRIADVNRNPGGRRANQLRSHPEGATAAGSLHGSRTPVSASGMRRTQNHFFDGAIEFLAPRSGHVGFRGLRRQHRLLGAAHAGQHRCIAGQVAVHAHTEVDLQWRGIGSKFRHHPENRIRVQALELLEQELTPHFLCGHIIVQCRMTIRRTCIMSLTLALGGAAFSAGGPQTVPRIISLSPHITELLFAAGAGDRIVGVDDASDYPAAVAGIARVGEPAALDVEGMLRLKPTLIVLWDSGTPERRKAELKRLNLKLYVTDQHRRDDIGTALLEFGRLAGTEPAAAAAARRYQDERAGLRAQYAGRPRLKVFYQVWDRPLYTLSGAHVVSEVLSLCGGDNVFADLATLAPAIDKEAVLARDPDVILVAATGADGARQMLEWNRFPNLRAVRSHRIFSVDPSLVGRMAPRILQGVREVCGLLDAARAQPLVGDPRTRRR